MPQLAAEDVRLAVEKAAEAQRKWAARPARDRALVLRRWYELVLENVDDLGAILTLEQGKPFAEAKAKFSTGPPSSSGLPRKRVAPMASWFPRLTSTSVLWSLSSPSAWSERLHLGTFPCDGDAQGRPALAAGCAVVIKPASQTPFRRSLWPCLQSAPRCPPRCSVWLPIRRRSSAPNLPPPPRPQAVLHRLEGGGRATLPAVGADHKDCRSS